MRYDEEFDEYNVNVSDTSDLKEFFKGIIGFGLFIVLLCGFFSFVTDVTIKVMPMSFEKSFNRKVVKFRRYDSNNYVSYEKLDIILKEFVNKSPLSELDINVKVLESKGVNAFATQDYTIIITRGLFEKLKSDDEIAFVIGHELGHIAHRDYLSKYGKVLIPKIIVESLFNNDKAIYAILDSGMDIAAVKFSQEDEKNADLFSLEMLKKTSRNTQASIAVMELFLKEYKSPKWVYMMSTHPHPKDRISYLRNNILQK